MKLMSLLCPRCREDLEGANNSRVFFCRSCAIGIDLSREREREYPLQCIIPEIERRENTIYFAFWVFACRYNWISSTGDERGETRKDFWVPAFFIKNISYFGDIGLYYSNRDLKPRTGRCRNRKVFPADRGEAHASVYPRIYAFSREAERKRDIVEITTLTTRLAWVPFYIAGREYIDSLLGWAYPSGALI